MNVRWSVHWGCNYQDMFGLLKNPSSVHLIGTYFKWRGLSTKHPNSDFTVTCHLLSEVRSITSFKW